MTDRMGWDGIGWDRIEYSLLVCTISYWYSLGMHIIAQENSTEQYGIDFSIV